MFRIQLSFSSRSVLDVLQRTFLKILFGGPQIPCRVISAGDFEEFLDVNHWQQ